MATNRELRKALKMVAKFRRQRDNYLAEKEEVAALIAEKAEGGKVLIVYGGMDCDCSQFWGRTVICPATLVHVTRELNRIYNDAEGPTHHGFEKPSRKANVSRGSKDLAAEAFEDGHPHSVTYSA